MQARAAWERMTLPARVGMVKVLGTMMIVALALAVFAGPAHAKYASYVIDADTGEVLHGINEDTRNYPASLTKMMTLYLVFERLREKTWSMSTKLKVSSRAARQPASKLGIQAGTTISVQDAILALVTKSANDVATAIAENISGRERNFALKMTAKARSLGMSRTTFRNASGLPHRAQLSTAKDMSTLARALLRDFPEYYYLFSTKQFAYQGHIHKNHNKLLDTFPGVDGFKTGYIRASGFNLVASATRDGRRIIGVVFGGRSSRHRNLHMTDLLNKGFAALKAHTPSALIASATVPDAKPEPSRAPVKVASAAPTTRHTDAWAVQVGAFSREDQARAAAENAISRAGKYLDGGRIHIVPLEKRNGKVLHRARIEGISKRDAYRTCRVIRDCMELKATYSPELAQSTTD